jgi:hypothetical protein
MRSDLIKRIQRAVAIDPQHPPVVPLKEYFEGNTQEDCIAPNQVGSSRPGLAELYQIFSDIEARSNVQAVLVGIHDEWAEALKYEDIWPAAENVHILSSARLSEVEQWISGLAADGVVKGWPYGKHSDAPETYPGFDVYTVCWD